MDHMLVKFEQNRIVRTTQNFELFVKKWLTISDKVLTPLWKTFLYLKQLFDAKLYSKKYGSATRVTKLKLAPNMADLSSLKDSDRCLNLMDWFMSKSFDITVTVLSECAKYRITFTALLKISWRYLKIRIYLSS